MPEEEKIHPKPEDLEIKTPKELDDAKRRAWVVKKPETPDEVKTYFQKKIDDEKAKPDSEQDKTLIAEYQKRVDNPELYLEDEIVRAMKERARQELLPSVIDKVVAEFQKESEIFKQYEEELRTHLQHGLEIVLDCLSREIFSNQEAAPAAKWEKLQRKFDFRFGRGASNDNRMSFLVGLLEANLGHYFTEWHARRIIEGDRGGFGRGEKPRLFEFLSRVRKDWIPKTKKTRDHDEFMAKVGLFWDGEKYKDTGQYWHGTGWAKVPENPEDII